MKNITVSAIITLSVLYSASFAQNINKPNIPGPAGLKVNSYSGGLFYHRTDLHIPGRGLSIDLSFHYNSTNTGIDLGYGPGWSMTYSMMCTPGSNNAVILREDGRKDVYTWNGSAYIAPVGIFDSLVQYLAGKFKLITKQGTSYFFDRCLGNLFRL